ncbi:hypothetical protein ACQP3C_25165, partial [Escherichia coli]
MEDSHAKCNVMNCGGLAQQFTEEKNTIMWPRDHSCDSFVKNVDAFCTCPKSLPEAKVKSFVLMELGKEISKQTSIDSVVCLLMLLLTEIYNE